MVPPPVHTDSQSCHLESFHFCSFSTSILSPTIKRCDCIVKMMHQQNNRRPLKFTSTTCEQFRIAEKHVDHATKKYLTKKKFRAEIRTQAFRVQTCPLPTAPRPTQLERAHFTLYIASFEPLYAGKEYVKSFHLFKLVGGTMAHAINHRCRGKCSILSRLLRHRASFSCEFCVPHKNPGWARSDATLGSSYLRREGKVIVLQIRQDSGADIFCRSFEGMD